MKNKEKIAILLTVLGKKIADEILSELESDQADVISKEMKTLKGFSPSTVKECLSEFNERFRNNNKELYKVISKTPPEEIGVYLASQDTQATALLLIHLDDHLCEKIILRMPSESQKTIIQKLKELIETEEGKLLIKESAKLFGRSKHLAEEEIKRIEESCLHDSVV